MTFVKHDSAKTRYDLSDVEFEDEIAEVLTHGAAKYGDNNYQKAAPAEAANRYYAALRRHLAAWRKGEVYDNETDLPHLAHAACCIQFLRWYERNECRGLDFEDEREALAHALAERIDGFDP